MVWSISQTWRYWMPNIYISNDRTTCVIVVSTWQGHQGWGKMCLLNPIKNRHVSKITWLDHYTCQLPAIEILCQAQFLSWYTLVRVIFFLSQKEDKVKGMNTWWTYKYIFPFYFAKRNCIASNGQWGRESPCNHKWDCIFLFTFWKAAALVFSKQIWILNQLQG